VRENWRDLNFWRWWWRHQVRTDAKIAVAALLGVALVVGGYFASSNLTGADAANGAGSYVLQTTVTRVVTVRTHGRTVVRRIPVVIRRSVAASRTAYETLVDTRYVTTPGKVQKVFRYVPVVKRSVVRVNGKTTTLTQTRLVPTVKTQTLTNVVTNQQTVTNVVNHTDTVVQPVTTVVTKTVTLPPNTVTQVQTVTVTQTQTVTQPGPTVTITVPTLP
jgi:hypothetical protein